MVVVGDIKPLCFVYVSLFRSLKKGRKQPHIRKSGKIKVMGASRMRSLTRKIGRGAPIFRTGAKSKMCVFKKNLASDRSAL